MRELRNTWIDGCCGTSLSACDSQHDAVNHDILFLRDYGVQSLALLGLYSGDHVFAWYCHDAVAHAVVFIFIPNSFPNETNEDRLKMCTAGFKGALASGITVFVFEMLLCACYVYLKCQDRFNSWLATYGEEFDEWLSRAVSWTWNMKHESVEGSDGCRLSSGYRYPGNNSRMIALPDTGYTVYIGFGHSIDICPLWKKQKKRDKETSTKRKGLVDNCKHYWRPILAGNLRKKLSRWLH